MILSINDHPPSYNWMVPFENPQTINSLVDGGELQTHS